MAFRKLGVIEAVARVIDDEKFEKPTEIQEKTIPLIAEGKDVIAGSATGSGKTLAFGAGIIQHTERGKGVQALVLTPTRELAEQVGRALIKFSKHKPITTAIIYGGVSINPQMSELRHAEVVVGTPGRILDHLERQTLDVRRLKILVLDEADRMLDMGFIDDVERIIKACPKQRQTLLFSATITTEIATLSHRYMHDPIKVAAERFVDPKKLNQVYYTVKENMKLATLIHFIKSEKGKLAMVFCNTRHTTDFVADNLRAVKIDAMAIHGGFSQAKRTSVMKQFYGSKTEVLVCTDVAARGLDIKGVSHIYNYNIPNDSKEYIHRIGRTARAGAEGKIINLISERDYDNFSRVLRENDLNVAKKEVPEVQRIMVRQGDRREGGGFRDGGHGRSGGGDHGRFERGGRGRPMGRGRSEESSDFGSRPSRGRGGHSHQDDSGPKKNYGISD